MKISTALWVSLPLCVALGASAASADPCDLATTAAIAQAKVPHASMHVTAVPGEAPSRAEMIFTDDKAYVQMNGAWRSMDYSPKTQIDRINAVRVSANRPKQTCEKVGNETIKGDPATVLMVHTDDDGRHSDARIWISDKSGLLLKSELRIDKGDEIVMVTDDFRYDNIVAPTGVK